MATEPRRIQPGPGICKPFHGRSARSVLYSSTIFYSSTMHPPSVAKWEISTHRFGVSRSESPPTTDCVYRGGGSQTLEPFACKFAVPPHLEISVSPPSGASLAGHGGAITQSLTLQRKAAAASKPLKMRLLIEFKRNGRAVHDVVEFADFPSDL